MHANGIRRDKSATQHLHSNIRNLPAPCGIYLGVGGFANLDLIGEFKPPAAILFDINPNQRKAWSDIFEIFRQSSDRRTAAGYLIQLPQMLAADYQMNEPALDRASLRMSGLLSDIEKRELDARVPNLVQGDETHTGLRDFERVGGWRYYVDSLLDDSYSFLGSDAAFNHVKTLVEKNAIGSVTLDLKDKKAWRGLGHYLAGKDDGGGHAKIGMLYLSNNLRFLDARGTGIDYQGKNLHADNSVLKKVLMNLQRVVPP